MSCLNNALTFPVYIDAVIISSEYLAVFISVTQLFSIHLATSFLDLVLFEPLEILSKASYAVFNRVKIFIVSSSVLSSNILTQSIEFVDSV